MGTFDYLIPEAKPPGTFDHLIPMAHEPEGPPRDPADEQAAQRARMGAGFGSQVVRGIPLLGGMAEKGAAALNAGVGHFTGDPGDFGTRYTRELEASRNANAEYGRSNPGLSTLGNVLGSVAGVNAVAGGAPAGLTRGPAMTVYPPGGAPAVRMPREIGAVPQNAGNPLAQRALGITGNSTAGRIAVGGASGAALGAADAALKDENVGEGATAGAIGGAAAPVVGRLIGAAANRTNTGNPAGTIAQRSVAPTAGELEALTNVGYDAARGSGVEFHPNVISSLGHTTQTGLENVGVPRELAPHTFAMLDRLIGADPGRGFTVNDLLVARQMLGNVRRGAAPTSPLAPGNPNEAMAATRAIGMLDHYLENVPAADVRAGDPAFLRNVYPEARANSAAQHRIERAEGLQNNARIDAGSTHSGNNLNNRTRQAMRPILKSEALQAGHSPEEIAQLERAVLGTRTGNTLRSVSSLLGGGGGLGRAHVMGWGGTAGAALGGALGGVPGGVIGGMVGAPAAALPGWAARAGAEASTARNMRRFNDMARMNSPAGRPVQQARNEGAFNNENAQEMAARAAKYAQTPITEAMYRILNGGE